MNNVTLTDGILHTEYLLFILYQYIKVYFVANPSVLLL